MIKEIFEKKRKAALKMTDVELVKFVCDVFNDSVWRDFAYTCVDEHSAASNSLRNFCINLITNECDTDDFEKHGIDL